MEGIPGIPRFHGLIAKQRWMRGRFGASQRYFHGGRGVPHCRSLASALLLSRPDTDWVAFAGSGSDVSSALVFLWFVFGRSPPARRTWDGAL